MLFSLINYCFTLPLQLLLRGKKTAQNIKVIGFILQDNDLLTKGYVEAGVAVSKGYRHFLRIIEECWWCWGIIAGVLAKQK